MSEIYITGHRNPDMDSICAAYAYASLKNSIDRVNHYNAVRCGHLSDNVKGQFSIVGIEPPPYLPDVNPKVGSVLRQDEIRVDCNAPVYDFVKIFHGSRPSAVPLFDGDRFIGLLSTDDIASWFLNEYAGTFPTYNLTVDNMLKVLPCKLLKTGSKTSFTAPILSGAAHASEHPDAVIVMPYSKRYALSTMETGVPAIVFTDVDGVPDLDCSSYDGTVLISELELTATIRRLRMAAPVKDMMGPQGPCLQVSDLFDEAREKLMPSNFRGLAVLDGDSYAGFVTRRCFLKKPVHKVILVDHNEPNQSIRGIENAQILEIIDHHRLDAPKTDLPIFIDAEPLGSTCTIIYQLFLRNNVVPDIVTAKVLLAGILADTICLRSPTTTGIDMWSAERLAPLAGVVDFREFGRMMLEKVECLENRDPESAITSDFKVYKEGGVSLGIGQCEVPTLNDLESCSGVYLAALERVRRSNGLDWVLFMVTDVIPGKSILLSTSHRNEAKLPYGKIADHVFDMKNAVSRKKQLLPEILHIIKGVS